MISLLRDVPLGVLVCLLAFGVTSADAGNAPHNQAGTTGASFLKIGVGARPVGLGGAYTAVSNDANSVYWNPAGLTRFNGAHISLMHNKWFQGINYEFFGLAYGDSASSGFAFGLTFLWMDDIPVTTFSDRLGTSGNTFTSRDLAFSFAYAHQVFDIASIGVSLKRIRSNLAGISATATAFDFGLMVAPPPVPGLTFGATVQNVGTKLKFVKDGDRLPVVFKAGTAYSYRQMALLSVDISKPVDNRVAVSVGGEFVVMKTLALRGGYNSTSDLDNGLMGGAGVKIKRIAIDYAFVPYGVLGNTHRISAMYRF